MTIAPDLLAALDMVVFVRRGDGSFIGSSSVPEWFQTLTGDLSFPFLGTFLETANEFWAGSRTGCVRSGPCAEADASGKEFHFEVVAISTGQDKYLVFERRPDAEPMREILQKARQAALDRDQLTAKFDRLTSNLAAGLTDLNTVAHGIGDLAARLRETDLSAAQEPLVDRLHSASTLLAGRITTLRKALTPPPRA